MTENNKIINLTNNNEPSNAQQEIIENNNNKKRKFEFADSLHSFSSTDKKVKVFVEHENLNKKEEFISSENKIKSINNNITIKTTNKNEPNIVTTSITNISVEEENKSELNKNNDNKNGSVQNIEKVEKGDNSNQELSILQPNKNSIGGDKALIGKASVDGSELKPYSSSKENTLEEIKKSTILLSKDINNQNIQDGLNNSLQLLTQNIQDGHSNNLPQLLSQNIQDGQSNNLPQLLTQNIQDGQSNNLQLLTQNIQDGYSSNPQLLTKDSEKESVIKNSNNDINLPVHHSKENLSKINITNYNNENNTDGVMTSSKSSESVKSAIKLSIESNSDKAKETSNTSNDRIQLKDSNFKNQDKNINVINKIISASVEKDNTMDSTNKIKNLPLESKENTNLMVLNQKNAMHIEKAIIGEKTKDFNSCKQNDKSDMAIDNDSLKDKSIEKQINDNSNTVDVNSSTIDQENRNNIKLKKDNIVEKSKDLVLNKNQNDKMSVLTEGGNTKNNLKNNNNNESKNQDKENIFCIVNNSKLLSSQNKDSISILNNLSGLKFPEMSSNDIRMKYLNILKSIDKLNYDVSTKKEDHTKTIEKLNKNVLVKDEAKLKKNSESNVTTKEKNSLVLNKDNTKVSGKNNKKISEKQNLKENKTKNVNPSKLKDVKKDVKNEVKKDVKKDVKNEVKKDVKNEVEKSIEQQQSKQEVISSNYMNVNSYMDVNTSLNKDLSIDLEKLYNNNNLVDLLVRYKNIVLSVTIPFNISYEVFITELMNQFSIPLKYSHRFTLFYPKIYFSDNKISSAASSPLYHKLPVDFLRGNDAECNKSKRSLDSYSDNDNNSIPNTSPIIVNNNSNHEIINNLSHLNNNLTNFYNYHSNNSNNSTNQNTNISISIDDKNNPCKIISNPNDVDIELNSKKSTNTNYIQENDNSKENQKIDNKVANKHAIIKSSRNNSISSDDSFNEQNLSYSNDSGSLDNSNNKFSNEYYFNVTQVFDEDTFRQMLSDISTYNWFNVDSITIELISDIIMNEDIYSSTGDTYPSLCTFDQNLLPFINNNMSLDGQSSEGSNYDIYSTSSYNPLLDNYLYNSNEILDYDLLGEPLKKRKIQNINHEVGYDVMDENSILSSRGRKKWTLQSDIWTISMNQNRSPYETWNHLDKSTRMRYLRLLSAAKAIFGSDKYVQNPLYIYCPICLRRLRQATIADPVMANIFGKGHHIHQHQRAVNDSDEYTAAQILLNRAREYSTNQKCVTPLPTTLKPPPPPGSETLLL